ncbi:cytochrome b5-like [Humulus lupulus]|uniref:cytochrome b5-like n=1 Tax=Humulus lupulus TaxID=3486 RepID=UPI002B407AD8|nr:cytochrome b5-like [Humulus lupulus]XP_062091327.1 cytochrome b5-like [Humulus lupulus]
MTSSDPKKFSFEEVAQHNHKKDCWIIISGKAYDVTPFLEEHPGGDEVLQLATEKDATDDFEDIGHSDNAKELMEKYYVGEVDISTLPKKPNYKPPQPVHHHSDQSSGIAVKILQFSLPLLILAIAFALQFYSKKK